MIYGNIERECEYIRKQAMGIASRNKKGREWSEDIASECVYNWLQNRESCTPEAFENYAIRMIENEISDKLRLRSTRRELQGVIPQAPETSRNPEREIVNKLEADNQLARMKARGEDSKTLEIVRLRGMGLTVPEIAQIMRMPRTTVTSRLSRAQEAARRAA